MSAARPQHPRTAKQTPPTPERTPRWSSTQAAADYAGVSLKTIYRWVREGILPASRAGKRLLRINLNDLDALMLRVG